LAERKGRLKDGVEMPGDCREAESRGEECSQEGVLCGRIVDQGEVEIAKGGFEVMSGLVFFGEVGGDGEFVGGFEDVDAPAEIEGVVRWAAEFGAGEDGGAPGGGRVLLAEKVGFVDGVEFEFRESFFVARELVVVVPAHGVDIGLANLARERGLVFV